jgi:N-acetyl-anhydromuramyl-L-alanine amidase AmpD
MLFTTKPLPIIDLPADAQHHTKGRRGFTPRYIVIHHTGGVWSGPWLTWQSNPAVSCHRLITKPGTNYKVVADKDTAYCAGFAIVGPIDPDTNDPKGVAPNFNLVSLNIELENKGDGKDPYTAAQLDMCAAQVAEWWGKYGYLPVVGHAEVDARKHDPRGFDWDDFSRRLDLALVTQRIEG